MALIMQVSESINMEFYQQKKKVTGAKIFLLRKVSQSSAAERVRQYTSQALMTTLQHCSCDVTKLATATACMHADEWSQSSTVYT